MGTQETIIYRLVKPNLTFGPYLSFLVFEAIIGHKNGRGPTRAHMGLGAQNPKTPKPQNPVRILDLSMCSWKIIENNQTSDH